MALKHSNGPSGQNRSIDKKLTEEKDGVGEASRTEMEAVQQCTESWSLCQCLCVCVVGMLYGSVVV